MLLSLFFLVADAASPAGSVAKAPASAPPSRKYSVEEACKHTAGHYDLCVATLSSAAPKTGDTAGMARVAILAAQQNASETATFLSSIYDDSNLENKTAQLQQCLEDCGERYIYACSHG
jgi:pectinesterase inhibitor-like protein